MYKFNVGEVDLRELEDLYGWFKIWIKVYLVGEEKIF